MSIETLEAVIAPPAAPQELPDTNLWRDVEARITKFPTDYRDYISRYGTGSIDSFIWIFNPASSNPNLNFEQQMQKQLQMVREINQSETENTITLFPNPNGLLPFGITDNGDLLAWEVSGNPDDWTVGVLGARTSPMSRFAMNFTHFLGEICQGRIICAIFPEDFPSANPTFSSGY